MLNKLVRRFNIKSIVYIVISALIFISCQKQVNMDAINIEKEKAAIQDVLSQYIISIENEDMGLYGRIMTHDSLMVNFGAFGDPVIGWKRVKKVIEGQNESLLDTKIEQSDVTIHISLSGKFAWATSLWNFKATMGEQQLNLPVRCTWILDKKENNWIISHWHKSISAG